MYKLPTVCVAAVLLPASAAFAASGTAPDLGLQIDRMLSATYQPDAPGVTVIVVKDGKTLLRKGYGMADLAQKRLLAPDTVMRIGSLTKQFTATAILMLVDEGKIKLDDDITVYLPDYLAGNKKITIENLLTHTSGIVSYTSKPDYRSNMPVDRTVKQMINGFKNDPLEFEPGSHFHYNNSGYFLLGAIIENVSGKTYDKFVEERIFVPLGMTRTAYEGHERSKAPRAVGYSRGEQGFAPSVPISMTQPYAAGSLVSTVGDLARWDAAVSSGKLLKAATWQRAFTPYILSDGKSTGYGYAWETGKFLGLPMNGHSGGINGFNTYALRLPTEKVYVAVLSNADSGLPMADDIAMRAAAIAIGKPFPEFKEIRLPASALDALSGTYQFDAGVKRAFRREGDNLVMQGSGGGQVGLNAFSETGFFIPNTLSVVEFARDAQGHPTTVTLRAYNDEQVGTRSGDAPPSRVTVKIDNAGFDALAGRYQIAPEFVIELTRDGERYFAQATNQPKLEVFAANDTTFFARQVAVELSFEDGAGGPLTLSQNGRKIKGAKLH